MKFKQTNSMMPREKFATFGAEALSDAELLAILLRTGTHGQPVQELASNVLKHFGGSLLQLCDASATELCGIPGMGKTKSMELCAAFALSRRVSMQRLATRADMTAPSLVASYMRDIFRDMQQENFYALLLDTKMRLIRIERITTGLVDRSLIHAREVFRTAIRESSSAIVICHNHPSGNITPSQADIEATERLEKAGKIIGIKLVDHIIVGSQVQVTGHDGYYSFLENGLLHNSH